MALDKTHTMDYSGLALKVTEIQDASGNVLLDSTSAVETGFIDGVTAGTAAASKAVVLGASKEIATITSATITTLTSTTATVPTVNATNVDAGASGTAGSVDVFPTTASKGKLTLSAADSAGNTTTTLTNASQGGARTYTLPDAGASGAFVLGGGNAAVALTGTGGTSTGTMTTLSAQVTSASITTAADGTHVATITFTGVAATDIVLITKAGGTNSATEHYTYKAVCTTNTITVTLSNHTAATALNGTVIFNILVVKA